MSLQDGSFADETLIAIQAARDPQAFLALYDLYFARVYNYIRYRSPDAAVADDLTALAFETALVRLQDYNPERGPFGAWLFGIARNLVAHDLRLRRRQSSLSLVEIGEPAGREPLPEDRLIWDETQEELLSAVRNLGERERDLIGLKFGARLTNRRIAELTGLSESNVGIILYRSLRKLRALLEQREL